MLFALVRRRRQTVATYELPVATRDLSQGLDGSRLVIVQRGDACGALPSSPMVKASNISTLSAEMRRRSTIRT